MKHRRVRSMTAAGIVLAHALFLQGTAIAEQDELTPGIRADTIEKLAEELADYVFSDQGRQMKEQLARNLRAGKYDAIADFVEFGEAVTQDLFDISGDRHLLIRYAPSDVADVRRRATLTGPERQRDSMRRKIDAAQDNFGFEEIEILPGNIGYLKLNRFEQFDYAGDTAFAAMQFLSNAKAIVIDLRHNNGGWNSMIQTLCSYFFYFEELTSETKLWEIHKPYENTVTQVWNLPHVPGKRLTETPVYILTSDRTYSSAEVFTDILQKRGRATVVGGRTRGGAHPTRGPEALNDHYILKMPVGRVINPVTGANWEGTGIEPDIVTDPGEALAAALKIIVGDLTAGNPEERFMNDLGYSFLYRNRLDMALFVFGKNVQLYPDSANCYDSLAEAYFESGNHKQAEINYRRSLELDPGNDNATKMLERLAKER